MIKFLPWSRLARYSGREVYTHGLVSCLFVKGSSDGGGAAAAAATIGAISVLSSLPTRLSKWASSLEQEASRDKASWHLARLPPHRVRHGLSLQPMSETSTGLVKNGGPTAACVKRRLTAFIDGLLMSLLSQDPAIASFLVSLNPSSKGNGCQMGHGLVIPRFRSRFWLMKD